MIKITIEGHQGSGKTTIANMIENFLNQDKRFNKLSILNIDEKVGFARRKHQRCPKILIRTYSRPDSWNTFNA